MARYDGQDLLPHKRRRLAALQKPLREEYTTVPAGVAVLLFRCEGCGTIHPLSHYSRNDQRRYGIRPYCRQCRREQRPAQRTEPDRTKSAKFCSACQTVHPIAAFYIDRTQEDGYAHACRESAQQRRRERSDARAWAAIEQARSKQTVELCAQRGLDHPGHDIKRCLRCQAIKHVDEFGNDWERADRKRSECLDCRSRPKEEA